MKKGEKFKRVQITKKDYDFLKKSERNEKSGKILKRIYAFKLLYKKWKYNKIADFIGITNDTMTDWIEIYLKNGIENLIKLNYKGRIPSLSQKQLIELKKKQSTFLHAKEAQNFIKNNYQIEYNINYVQELLKKNFNYPIKKQNLFLEK